MDSGPFRAPQPAERRVPSRPESAPRREPEPVEEPEPVKETPKVSSRRVSEPVYEAPAPRKRNLLRMIIGIVVILVILGAGVFAWSALSRAQNTTVTGIDSSKYQAVFLTSGEVYFGKLQPFNATSMKLTDIFYLQSTDSSTSSTKSASSTDTSNAQLIKLGSEVYGPDDQIIITTTQISRYMNMKADSKVVQLINKYQSK